jgi:hypothetical protein
MMSEWLKLMLEEVARKQAEAEQAEAEQRRRLAENSPPLRPCDDPAQG